MSMEQLQFDLKNEAHSFSQEIALKVLSLLSQQKNYVNYSLVECLVDKIAIRNVNDLNSKQIL